MIPIAWLAGFGGAFLVWSALNNRSPLASLRGALTGAPSSSAPLASPRTVSAGGPVTSGGGLAPAAGGTPVVTVPIGYGSHRLAPAAAAAYKAASITFGRTIPVTDSIRTLEQQAECYRTKPNLCAPPSPNAPHVRGMAIDVDGTKVNYEDPKLRSALSGAGFVRDGKKVDGVPEQWHWTYRG